jgi:hypothetical protein
MMKARFFASLMVIFLFANGCEDSFSPVVGYRDELVVYSVLDATRDTQYVRVYTTYNPPNYDPFSASFYTPVNDAIVLLTDNRGTSVPFHDTLVQAWDSTRYGKQVLAYVRYSFLPIRGRTYTLQVQSAKVGTALSVATVPGVATFSLANPPMLQFPELYDPSEQIVMNLVLSNATKGFMMRFFIDYEVAAPVPGGWLPQRVEVPQTIIRAVSLDTLEATYPTLQIRKTVDQGSDEKAAFGHSMYRTTLALLWRKYEKPGFIRMKRVVFYLYQVEANLFNYYNVANGFRDQLSVRTDEPDFTNIRNGVGLFGAFAIDSVSFSVPSDVGYRR